MVEFVSLALIWPFCGLTPSYNIIFDLLLAGLPVCLLIILQMGFSPTL